MDAKSNALKVQSVRTQKTSLVRFITAGSVDDGKSTLIGRLLFDSKAILRDQFRSLESARNKRTSESGIDLSFLTDGLEAEREQGITIDVAYRYFSTSTTRFIMADCPGHQQYTRNMFTGASNADAAVILIDSTRVHEGNLLEQTKRHVALLRLLNVGVLIVAVNKMDAVNYSQSLFAEIVSAFETFRKEIDQQDVHYVPISALKGDNVVHPSQAMPWYQGPTVLALLETVAPKGAFSKSAPTRFPVQLVIRLDSHVHGCARAYAGLLESGHLRVGQKIRIFPSGEKATIMGLVSSGKEILRLSSGQSAMVRLDRDIDLTRGDTIVDAEDKVTGTQELTADITWLDGQPLKPTRRYRFRQGTREGSAKIDVVNRLNLESRQREHCQHLSLNEIGRARLRLSSLFLPDLYNKLPSTGSFILIDEATHSTVAGGIICV
jgi:sulfate adenylyltransferase subunit 1